MHMYTTIILYRYSHSEKSQHWSKSRLAKNSQFSPRPPNNSGNPSKQQRENITRKYERETIPVLLPFPYKSPLGTVSFLHCHPLDKLTWKIWLVGFMVHFVTIIIPAHRLHHRTATFSDNNRSHLNIYTYTLFYIFGWTGYEKYLNGIIFFAT